MQKLMLLDAYALIFRAYYGLIRSPRINSKGQNTSAAFGFINTLEELLRTENPDFVAVAFDPPGGTFRHEQFPEYKATRDETPEDIRWAVPVIKDFLTAYGIKMVEVPRYEADDVIGTLAHRGAKDGLEVVMVTPDKDYAQLVQPNVSMLRPQSGAKGYERLGVEEVKTKFEVENPLQVIDLLGLMGDSADNIPGCPGVGAKTAVKLLADFGSIEGLLSHTDQLKGALKKKVEEHVEQIRESKVLATIVTDVPIDVTWDDMQRKTPNKEALVALYEDLEFRTFLRRLTGDAPVAAAPSAEPDLFSQAIVTNTNTDEETTLDFQENLSTLADHPHQYHLVESEEDAQELCRNLLTFSLVAFDTETTSVDAMQAQLVGMSFAVEGGTAWYVAVSRETEAAQSMVDAFRPFFEHPSIEKVGQNLKYDLLVLSHYGVEVAGPLFDTMLAHYVVQPEQRHNMDLLAEKYLHYRTIPIEALIGSGRTQRNMADLAPKDIVDYACEDADVTLRLYPILKEEMEKYEVTSVFTHIEMPLLPVLARMERNGVRLDTAALEETGRNFTERMQQLETDIYELAGHEFTITSPKQVGAVLFDELQISAKVKKTKTGQYSTSEEVLESLRDKHPIVEKILQHRALKKLLSTYVEALPKLILPETGHIHTSFNQAVTATGRLSSSNPNLQNIPVRGEDGREIRRAFVPEEGEVFFSADYSQIELRIMAHLSEDEHMVADFNSGLDIHAATAARIFHKPVEEVDRDERRKAKTANFGIIYGISAFGLSERMGVSRGEAKELIENYFATYPKVREYMNESIERAKQTGYITTQFGRRRYLADINAGNATVRGYAERNAVNAPIQGTAADIIKLAMVAIDRRLREEKLQTRMILQVHDELNFSVPPTELEQVRHLVVEEMERAFQMRVPLVAECGEGTNWLEAH
jgi:DNA-directed DNA polymerase